jgi:MFS family permease
VPGDRAVRGIFVILTAFLANQMSRPYVPVVVEEIVSRGRAGRADRAGGRHGRARRGSAAGGRRARRPSQLPPVLIGALLGGAVALGLMPLAPSVGGIGLLALVAVAFAAASSAVSAMVFGLLATEVPAARRSQTLNLVYLPLYAAGIIGPALGSIVVTAGLPAPFFLGAAVFVAGAVIVVRHHARPAGAAIESPSATPFV